MIKIEFSTTYIYNTTYLWKMLMPPLPCPKHHVCPQTLSSFGWCLLAPLAASWPLLLQVSTYISWPQLTAAAIIKITQSSDSSTGNGQKSMQFHWKDGRGRWILWRNLCSIWPSPSLSSSCFKKSDLKNIPLLILNRPRCPIVLVYSNFFITYFRTRNPNNTFFKSSSSPCWWWEYI